MYKNVYVMDKVLQDPSLYHYCPQPVSPHAIKCLSKVNESYGQLIFFVLYNDMIVLYCCEAVSYTHLIWCCIRPLFDILICCFSAW